jgi:hypothetical protein
MANKTLTMDMITREALRILHANLSFIGNVDRQYDSKFANSGAKIGSSLDIRKPEMGIVGDGRVLTVQDSEEQFTTLEIDTRKHIGLSFTSEELTLHIDDFAKRKLEPRMAQLASVIEADVINKLYKQVYQQVDNSGSSATFTNLLGAQKILFDSLCPDDNNIAMLLNSQSNMELSDSLKGQFNPKSDISDIFRKGYTGSASGFNFFRSSLLPVHVPGGEDGAYLADDTTAQTGSSIHIDTGTGTLLKGDVVTFTGVYRVHAETKAAQKELATFVVTVNYAGGEGDLQIEPPVVATGAYKNVSQAIPDGAAMSVHGTADTSHRMSLGFHKEAFTFATADLVMPKSGEASRQVMDGISMRMWQASDIVNDTHITRIDVMYGSTSQRPELAVRMATQ